MAILKTALEESLLSKSEQAVLRVLSRAALLNEGLIVLAKITEHPDVTQMSLLSVSVIEPYKKYLNTAIYNSLKQHRLPAISTTGETESQQSTVNK